MTPEEVARSNRELDAASASDILRWAVDRFSSRLTFATGFGAEGCVLIDLMVHEGLPIDLFTLDTGLLFPETYDLWRRLEARYAVTIRAVRPEHSVAEQGEREGPELWNVDADRCCELRKVQPLRAALAGFDAWITAIRRDQTPDRATSPVVGWDAKFGLVKVNPLVRWTHEDVWSHIRAHDVPYNPLHDHSYPSISCTPCTSPVAPGEDPRSGRWRGSEKKECGLHLKPAEAIPNISVVRGA